MLPSTGAAPRTSPRSCGRSGSNTSANRRASREVPMTEAPHPNANPFVGPRPFEAGERLYGRDHEVRKLLDLLLAERIVLLHSPSGAGKTSLIQAALIPALERVRFEVL